MRASAELFPAGGEKLLSYWGVLSRYVLPAKDALQRLYQRFAFGIAFFVLFVAIVYAFSRLLLLLCF